MIIPSAAHAIILYNRIPCVRQSSATAGAPLRRWGPVMPAALGPLHACVAGDPKTHPSPTPNAIITMPAAASQTPCVIRPPRYLKGGTVCLYACWHASLYACWHGLLVCLLARFACMLVGTVCLYACWHGWGPCTSLDSISAQARHARAGCCAPYPRRQSLSDRWGPSAALGPRHACGAGAHNHHACVYGALGPQGNNTSPTPSKP